MLKIVRLSSQSKDRLSRLKGKTGIKNWNVLARWAFAYSLKEGSVPAEMLLDYEDGVEMTWQTFAGEHEGTYKALLVRWCIDNGIDVDETTLTHYLCLHIERGIGYLSGTNFIKSIDDLLKLGLGEK